MILITDSNNGISRYNKIPWHFTEDLKFFNKTTVNNICIMGSTTAKDLGKPLRNRINIVISSNDECKDLGKLRPDYDGNDFIVQRCMEDALKEAYNHGYPHKEIFIVGGTRLYNEALNSGMLNKIYYTHINQSFDCDNFVEPLLNRDDMTYEILDKIKYDKVNIKNSNETYTNVELTFYLISKINS
jgi:dihydrofolate reductase